jgi:multidrug resistance efflux pump
MRWKAVGAAVLLLLAGVAAGLGYYRPWAHHPEVLKLPGVVEIQEVRLGPRVAGRVVKVYVREGDVVRPGQLLIRLDVPELEAQLAQASAHQREAEALLDKAQNGPRPEERDAAEAAYRAARARLDRLETGYREEDKRQAENEFKAAQVDLAQARDDYERARRLFSGGSIGRAEYDTARSGFDRAQRRCEAARAHHEMMQHGPRPEEIREARADAAQAEANWRLVKAGTRSEDLAAAAARVAEARARVSELEVDRKEANVYAPEPAVVEVVAVRVGDLVAANQPVVRVLRTGDLWVKVYVPETELARVVLHQKVEVVVDGYPDRRLTGEVFHIASESEFTPRNVQSVDERRHQVFGARVRVDDPGGIFKSGMAADVYIPLAD